MEKINVFGILQSGLTPTCALAFGFDRFDKTGRWRETRFGDRSDVGQ